MFSLIVLLILVWLPCAWLTGTVADAKGLKRDWSITGLLFGPIALIAVVGMPDRKMIRVLRALAEHQGAEIGDAEKEQPRQDSDETDLYPRLGGWRL